MKFGYARVSKNDQSLDIQLEKLRASGCDEIFMEKVSGAQEDRKELNRLLDKLRSGDTVCVVRLDRLGRRMVKLIELINDFKAKGINFVALENDINTTNPMGMILFSMCAAFSEMERELIRERIMAGLKAAHSKGNKGGRPRVLIPEKMAMLTTLRKNEEFSVKQICQMLGITKSVYYRALKREG